MKKRLGNFVSILVLVTFTLYLVPHEIVHVFYDHEDTEHHAHHGGPEFSTIHVHCDFLNSDLSDFLPGETPFRTEIISEVRVHYAELHTQCIRSIVALRDSRGPPVAG